MKILVAGSTGAIGRPLLQQLRGASHHVIGMCRSHEGWNRLREADVEPMMADATDAEAVRRGVLDSRPEVIINELTALPKHYSPVAMRESAERDRKVRLEGHANLLAAAREAGVRRYILQSSGFWYAPGPGLADEQAPLALDAPPGIAASVRTYAKLESMLAEAPQLEGVVLRYGFFYGGGTWYSKEGDMGEQVRQKSVPILGEGSGVWSFVHIEDAAAATASAVSADSGVYNVVDDQPSQQSLWLPAFARWAGGPEPPRLTEEVAQQELGAEALYYANHLRGASNAKAKRGLQWGPRSLEWFHGS